MTGRSSMRDNQIEVLVIPDRTDELLELLSEMFPPRCIRLGEDLISAHRYAAVAELVESLNFALRTKENTSNEEADTALFKHNWPKATVTIYP